MDDSDSFTSDSEEVRRSLDVLDKVLSEFDDIDASNEDLFGEDQTGGNVEPQTIDEPFNPPPIDRTKKPQDTPPALPKKERKANPRSDERNVIEPIESSPAESLKRSTSETSSHEYQEINSDLVDPGRRSKSLTRAGHSETLFRPIKPADRKATEQLRVPVDTRRGRSQVRESDLQKTRSRENIPTDSKLSRDNIQKRKISQRRSKSTERPINQRKKSSHSFPHQEPSKPGDHFHPDQIDPIAVDPRLLDPRFINTIPLDPKFRRKIDPMLLREQIPYMAPFNTMDSGVYLAEDQIPFPHLLHNPNIGLRMPPQLDLPYYPEDIPCDMLDPNFPPHLIPNGYIPIDPMDFGYHYPLHLGNMDPNFAPMHGMYPPEYPFDMPLEYYGIDPISYPVTNDKFGYPAQRMPPYVDKSLPLHEMERLWIASQQDQIALNNLRNLQASADRHRIPHGERLRDVNDMNNLNRSHYPGNSSVIDRSETRKSFQRNKMRKSTSRAAPAVDSLSSETSFRVGEAVNCQDEGEEIMSPTNFSSGGKDSGFEESSPTENGNSRDSKSPHPGTGSGFIVSGVFNDSSKMYIPAPPSPTPDYDEKCFDSDGGDSEIIQSSLYHVKPKREKVMLRNKDNNSDSLSDDSLQDGNNCPKEANTKSLQTMIMEFHNGLPTPVPLESYSDDSLDGSSAVPSRPSSFGVKSRRIMSMESLTSMDGSTTSFDYIKGGSSKSKAKNMQNMKRHSSYFGENSASSSKNIKGTKGKEGLKKSSSEKHGKFDTIRNLIKDGLLEGLDEQPPSFKPPPASNGQLEKNDSGVSSRASTTKTNESTDSSSKSSNSDFSEKIATKSGGVRKGKTKDPAPQPPGDLLPRQNSRSPTGHSWLHKQKRQAPTPQEISSKSKSEKKNEKITHVDEISLVSCQLKENKKMPTDSRYKPLTAKNKNDTATTVESSKNLDSIDSRINHPVFSGPLVTPEAQPPEVYKSNKQKKSNGTNNIAPVSMTSERLAVHETTERDSKSKPRKNAIEINSSPLNFAISKYSQKETNSYVSPYTSSKCFQEPKISNSNWSPKFGEESSKSRFNIFKGFWRRNKYSFDKF